MSVSISLFHYERTETACFYRLLLFFTPQWFMKAKHFHRELTHVLFSVSEDLDGHLSSLEWFGSKFTQTQYYTCLNNSRWK